MYDVCLSDEFLLQMREIFFIAEENLDRKTIEIQLQIIDIMSKKRKKNYNFFLQLKLEWNKYLQF